MIDFLFLHARLCLLSRPCCCFKNLGNRGRENNKTYAFIKGFSI